jgi:hypothetical protein
MWLARDRIFAWSNALWKLPSLPLMWIPKNGIHNRLEFLLNSTGSWKSLRDFHISHRAYYWFLPLVGDVFLIPAGSHSILGSVNGK